MARNQGDRKEELNDEDYSSEDMQVHRPGRGDAELEVDERAYTLLEYLNLEWPAQSIAVHGSKIYLGTNPQEGAGRAELIAIDIEGTDYRDLKYKDRTTPRYINKLRLGKHLFALSDTHLSAYRADSLDLVGEVAGSFGYGLCATDDAVYAGTQDGTLLTYTHDLRLQGSSKLHEKSIETVGFADGVIYTGSVDHTLRLSDKNGQVVRTVSNDSDINCLDVSGHKLAYGDDNGRVRLADVRGFSEEAIEWHSTPVSAVRWKDADVFASCSDEQVCLWDTSLVGEWDTSLVDERSYHKYLLFVHQGQQLYKDVGFDGDRVITTALDGLCIFTPVSFGAEVNGADSSDN